MSTPAISFDDLGAKPVSQAQAIDFSDLGGKPVSAQAQPEQHGFLYNAGKRVLDNFIAPVTGGVSMAQGTPEQAAAAGLNAINSGLQFIAPGADPYMRTVENAQSEHPYANLAGDAASIGLMGAGALGGEALPSTARAGALFNEVAQAANDKPVILTRTQPALDAVANITNAGGPVLKAPNDLMLRSQTVNPISYEEARRFYNNITNLSAQDKLAANKPMKAAVGDLREAFKQDIGDTAASVGKGEQYNQAMKEFRQASNIQDLRQAALKYAVPTALGSAVSYPALKALWDLLIK